MQTLKPRMGPAAATGTGCLVGGGGATLALCYLQALACATRIAFHTLQADEHAWPGREQSLRSAASALRAAQRPAV